MDKDIDLITDNKAIGIIPIQSEDRLTGVVGYNRMWCEVCHTHSLNCMTGFTGSIFHLRGNCTKCDLNFRWKKDLGSSFNPTIASDESQQREIFGEGLSYLWKIVLRKRKNSSARIVCAKNLEIEWKKPNA